MSKKRQHASQYNILEEDRKKKPEWDCLFILSDLWDIDYCWVTKMDDRFSPTTPVEGNEMNNGKMYVLHLLFILQRKKIASI